MHQPTRSDELHYHRARLVRLHTAAAAEAGIRPSRVRLVIPQDAGRRQVDIRRLLFLLTHRAVLSYPLAALRAESDRVVYGTVAHEHQHFICRLLPTPDIVARAAGVFLVLLAPVVLAAPITLALLHLGVPALVAVFLYVAALGAYFLTVILRIPTWYPHSRRSAAAWRVEELRCDLAAARVVGRDAVLEMLFNLLEHEVEHEVEHETRLTSSPRRRAGLWSTRDFQDDHPDTLVRIHAVEEYDGVSDPLAVARASLQHDPASSR